MEAEIMLVESVPEAGAELFIALAQESVLERGRFVVSLEGGGNSLAMYEILVKRQEEIPWEDILFFWGDERFVPYSHELSNYGKARALLFEKVPVPEKNIHPWPYENAPEASAESYSTILSDLLGSPPSFDLVLLGLGEDGHTASLFPGTGAVNAQGLTVASYPQSQQAPRLSLTPEALNQGRIVAFMVSGERKREILRQTLHGPKNVEMIPAQAIGAKERLIWIIDQKL